MNRTNERSLHTDLLAIAVGLVLAVVAAGCAVDAPPADATDADADADAPIPTLHLDERDQAALDAAGADDPCACTTDDCVTSWIDQEVGCDVCVVVVCDGVLLHGCNLCEPAPAGSPPPTVHPKHSSF